MKKEITHPRYTAAFSLAALLLYLPANVFPILTLGPNRTLIAAAALTNANSLDLESPVTVVGLFGSDNSIAGLVAPHVLAEPAGYKPFDHTVVNHMLHFDGAKGIRRERILFFDEGPLTRPSATLARVWLLSPRRGGERGWG